MPATAPLRHLKECRQRKCNTGEIPHATLRKSICIFEEKVLAKNIAIHDIDLSVLPEFGLTYETYFPEADSVAEFIYSAKRDGMDIICQCEYGESRSSGCAAAILEHFYKNGISIFADYRYYPNQVVYHKVFDALENYKRKMVVPYA